MFNVTISACTQRHDVPIYTSQKNTYILIFKYWVLKFLYNGYGKYEGKISITTEIPTEIKLKLWYTIKFRKRIRYDR